MFPSFTWSYLSWLVIAAISFACAIKLWKTYKQNEVKTVKYFSLFFIHFGLFLGIMGLPGIVTVELSPEQLGAFYIFGHMFLYSSFAYFSRIPTYIWKPSWEKPAFILNLIAGGIVTYVNILYWNLPALEPPITVLNVIDPVGPLIAILAIINWVIGGTIAFGYMAYKNKGNRRTKLTLIAIGITLIAIAGPLHDLTTSLTMLIIADVFTFLAIIFLMAGIYTKSIFGGNE